MEPETKKAGGKLRTMSELRRFIEENSMPVPWSGCWIWMRHPFVSKGGIEYGSITHARKGYNSNRATWLAYYGEPGEKHVLHTCDVTLCVNPRHLYLGTHQQNMLDRKNRGRGAAPNTGKFGEKSTGHIYTDAQREQVITLRLQGLMHKEIAAIIGMHEEYVARLCRWKLGSFLYSTSDSQRRAKAKKAISDQRYKDAIEIDLDNE